MHIRIGSLCIYTLISLLSLFVFAAQAGAQDYTFSQDLREETISMKISNRRAKADREADLNALEAYANIGVTPEDWKRFRVQYREFFPETLLTGSTILREDGIGSFKPTLK